MKKIFSVLLLSVFLSTACSSSRKVSVSAEGMSFKTAVRVNSVEEEYQYIKRQCANCRIVKQTLRFYKGKPYDVLDAHSQTDGDKTYYFDISSFYGKNF